VTAPIHDALASHDDYAVGPELHAVPPHLVHEVRFRGRRAVCKVATGPLADPVTEARATEFVGRETTVPVPEVLAVGRDPDHYVAAWVDDLPGEDRAFDEPTARAMGRGLATLHAETEGRFDATGHLRGWTDCEVVEGEEIEAVDVDALSLDARDTWSDTLLDRIEARKGYLADVEYGDVAERVAAFVRDRRALFDAAEGTALLHGTYLPEHVATSDGRVDCVVDFEHALVGPPEYDYLRTAIPVFANRGEEHGVPEPVFREAYESVRSLPRGFEARREAHALVQTVSYLRALFVQDRHEDPTEGAEWFRAHVESTLERLRERSA
jgi:fructosamine-3-kinase